MRRGFTNRQLRWLIFSPSGKVTGNLAGWLRSPDGLKQMAKIRRVGYLIRQKP